MELVTMTQGVVYPWELILLPADRHCTNVSYSTITVPTFWQLYLWPCT